MDELIEEIDIAEILEEADYEMQVLNAIGSLEHTHFRFLVSRHGLLVALERMLAALKRFHEVAEEALAEAEFSEWVEKIRGDNND